MKTIDVESWRSFTSQSIEDENGKVLGDAAPIRERGPGGSMGTSVAGEPREDDAIIVRVVGFFGLMVSEKKAEILCIVLPKRVEECPFTVGSPGGTNRFSRTSDGSSAEGTMDKEIANSICRA